MSPHPDRHRQEHPMLRGLTTVTHFADDVTAAADWYAELLGVEPYFRREVGGSLAYTEFRIGDFQHELGILDRRFAAPDLADRPGGPLTYWAVDDLDAT